MDCITFANEALRAHTGSGPFDFVFGGPTPPYNDLRGALDLWVTWRKRNGADLIDQADERWERHMSLYPRHGMLVGRRVHNGNLLRFAFGVVVGTSCAFVTEAGIVLTMPEVHDRYWSVT